MRNPCAGITRFRFYGSNLSPPIDEHPLASTLLTGGKGIKKVWNRQNILREIPVAFWMVPGFAWPRHASSASARGTPGNGRGHLVAQEGNPISARSSPYHTYNI